MDQIFHIVHCMTRVASEHQAIHSCFPPDRHRPVLRLQYPALQRMGYFVEKLSAEKNCKFSRATNQY